MIRTAALCLPLLVAAGAAVPATASAAANASAAPAAGRPHAAAAAQQPGTFVGRDTAHERLADTRRAADHLTRPGPHGTLRVPVLGAGRVQAASVTAVQVNVTVVHPQAAGYLTVFADGTTRPGTSNVSFATGETRAGAVLTRVGADGRIAIYNGSAGSADIVVDVTGYYVGGAATAAGALTALAPARLLDTRRSLGATAPGPHGRVDLPVLGRGGVPAAGVSAVVLTVTVTGAEANGYVVAHAGGTPLPRTTSVSFAAGRTVGDQVIAEVGADGTVALDNRSVGRVQLVADVAGWYRAGTPDTTGAYVPVAPTRIVDFRVHTPQQGYALPGAGDGPLPPVRVAGFAMTVTVTEVRRRSGYLTADTTRPDTADELAVFTDGSLLNYALGATVSNLGFSPGRSIAVAAHPDDGVAIIVDVSGYFTQDPATSDGAVSGRLTAAADGTAAKDVYLTAFDSRTGTAVAYGDGATDDRGDYVLAQLPPSPAGYDLCVSPLPDGATPTGFVGRCYGSATWSLADQDAGRPAPDATPVPVGAGLVTAGIDLALDPAGAIVGRVLGTDGSPLPGVYLDVYSGGVLHRLDATDGGYTQLDGSFRIRNVPPGGDYAVCTGVGVDPDVLPRCYQDVPYPARADLPAGVTTVGVTAGRDTTVDLALPPSGAVSGRVTAAASGTPVSHVPVVAYDAAGDAVSQTKTNDAGQYVLASLEPGRVRVCFGAVGRYQGQCYRAAPYPASGPTAAATPVDVTGFGVTVPGVDAALATG